MGQDATKADVAAVIRDVLPKLRRDLWIGRGLTGAAGILILAALWAWFHENLAPELASAALLVWGSALGVIWLWLKRRVQRRVMPLLAGA